MNKSIWLHAFRVYGITYVRVPTLQSGLLWELQNYNLRCTSTCGASMDKCMPTNQEIILLSLLSETVWLKKKWIYLKALTITSLGFGQGFNVFDSEDFK